jgi:hypothetical protein
MVSRKEINHWWLEGIKTGDIFQNGRMVWPDTETL